jgi:drug/metabolite transporter (DMT)-like permease
MGTREWLLLLTLSVVWGASFFFGKIALAELRPFTVVLGRWLAAMVLIVLVVIRGQALPRDGRTWRALAVMAVLNNLVPFTLLAWGQTQITSGLASILNATTPLFTVMLAHALTDDERLTFPRLAGVLLGFGGVIVMIGPAALAGLGRDVLAQVACLGAALSYACAGIFGRRLRGIPPLVTATGQATVSALLIFPVALIVDRPWLGPAPSLVTWGALFGIAIPSTAAGYVIYFRILSTAGATNLLLVTFLIPVSARSCWG